MKQYCTFTLFVTFFSLNQLFAQQQNVISGGGNYTEGAGGSVSWTLGEVIIQTGTSGTHDATQGFHQGNIYVTGLEEIPELKISVFPNPTSDYFTITAPEFLTLNVYNSAGQLVLNQLLNEGNNQVDVTGLARGTYNLMFENANYNRFSAQLVVM